MPRSLPRAVIDLGSNSGRVVVVRAKADGALEILADGRVPLRLARDLNRHGRLSEEAIARTVSAVEDFLRLARGAGVKRPVVVATSAIREAKNRTEVVARIRRATGLSVDVLSGDEEAAAAFRGAIEKLPIESGLMFDLGGGSLEITRFHRRRLQATWTLPLGALRLADRFLKSDPPSARHLARLREYLDQSLSAARVPRLSADEHLIATGGTVRNLAKIDRRSSHYPLERLHGYVLTQARLKSILRRLVRRGAAGRGSIPGMNAERADSIVGGAVCLESAMWWVGARTLTVSGQGTREGLLYAAARQKPSAIADARDAMFHAVLRRFSTWDEAAGRRRADLALRLFAKLEPDASAELCGALRLGALALDVGRSVDYYNRHRHAGAILRSADLGGLTPREVMLLSTLVVLSGDEVVDFAGLRPLLLRDDEAPLRRAAVVLAMAEAIQQRTGPRESSRFKLVLTARRAKLSAPSLRTWEPRDLAERFERVFGRKLSIE